MGMLRRAGLSLKANGDSFLGYGLCELSNGLRLLMRGEVSLEQFKEVWVGSDGAPLDIDALFPGEPKEVPDA